MKFDTWFAEEDAKEWLEWKNYCEKWCEYRSKKQSYDEIIIEIKSLKKFFIFYLNGKRKLNSLDKFIEEINKNNDNISILENTLKRNNQKKSLVKKDIYVIANFVDYVFYISNYRISKKLKNPYLYIYCDPHARIHDVVDILEIDSKWNHWVEYINKFIELNNLEPKIYFKIFIVFLKEDEDYSNLNFFFSRENDSFKYNLIRFLNNFLNEKISATKNNIYNFLEFVLINRYGGRTESRINPLLDYRNSNLQWIVEVHGDQWKEWVEYAGEWFENYMIYDHAATKRSALKYFFNIITNYKHLSDPKTFFKEGSNYISNKIYKEYLILHCNIQTDNVLRRFEFVVTRLCDFILAKIYGDSSNLINPFESCSLKSNQNNTLESFYCEERISKEWFEVVGKYNKVIEFKKTKKRINKAQANLFNFLLVKNMDVECITIKDVLLRKDLLEKFQEYLIDNGYSNSMVISFLTHIRDFFDFIIDNNKKFNTDKILNPFKIYKQRHSLTIFDKFIYENGSEWSNWCNLAKEWINSNSDLYRRTYFKETPIFIFFNEVLKQNGTEYSKVELFFIKTKNENNYLDIIKNSLIRKGHKAVDAGIMIQSLKYFTTWVLQEKLKNLFYKGVLNPLGNKRRELIYIASDRSLDWIEKLYGPIWLQWINYCKLWLHSYIKISERQLSAIRFLFEKFLIFDASRANVINFFILYNSDMKNNLLEYFNTGNKKHEVVLINYIYKFFDYIFKKILPELDHIGLNNPLIKSNTVQNYGKTTDIEIKWFTKKYGIFYTDWISLASAWLKIQVTNVALKLKAVILFLEGFLIKLDDKFSDVENFFKLSESFTTDDLILSLEEFSDAKDFSEEISVIVNFLGWVINKRYYYKNAFGVDIPIYTVPFKRVLSKRIRNLESVYSAIPYQYISRLKKILCPQIRGNFSDWKWAISYCDVNLFSSVWFEVSEKTIDKSDPDCVWIQTDKKFYMWSPVAAVALWVKLNLPLRTYQVRMLDSGEADEWRYVKGQWDLNHNPLIIKKRNRGVFRRQYDSEIKKWVTSIYISTNKTADTFNDTKELGYTIQWNNIDVLYWLEKLRNWQEKYNPLNTITDCSLFEPKHLERLISSYQLNKLGKICFLFRNAAAKNLTEKDKPISDYSVNRIWFFLLENLEEQLKKENDELFVNSSTYFLKSRSRTTTNFPLHCLRVSLLTIYSEYSGLPLEFISKYIAGHSRLIMTLHYIKPSNTKITEHLNKSYIEAQSKSQEDIRVFFRDQQIDNIENFTSYNDLNTIKEALKNKNIVTWQPRYYGLCLASANSFENLENESLANGCMNGGEKIIGEKNGKILGYKPVPHHKENCVRCRWFITDARYLSALVAHFNFLSYKTFNCAENSRKYDEEINKLESKLYQYEQDNNNDISKKINQLYSLKKRELIEMDEYAKDSFSTLYIIKSIIDIESKKDGNKSNILALGEISDLSLAFEETNSELLHLLLLCSDGNVYPEIRNEIYKTPAIEKLILHFSKFLISSKKDPFLLYLDKDEQFIAINSLIRSFNEQNGLITDKFTNLKKLLSMFNLDCNDEQKEAISLIEYINTKKKMNN
ncbi:gamma-mobile-trio integrase GmtZ [Acinetobacter baumannii]|uniref:gamma-mobile-trio integrase GmtZ n=3 Tax=Moraxellaceae TaxID=468 RepID=UPI00148ECDF5|nr:VPA1269 family protein [Acinetobacter baumannii]